jgi:hypothetical protein
MYFEEPKHDPVSSACLMESHKKIPFIIMIYRKKENKMLRVCNNTDADCRKKISVYAGVKNIRDGLRQPKAFDVSKWIQNIASLVTIESRSFIGYIYISLNKKKRGKKRTREKKKK